MAEIPRLRSRSLSMRGSCVTRNDELPPASRASSSNLRHLLSRRPDRDQRLISRSPHCVCPYCCSSILCILVSTFHLGVALFYESNLFPRVSFRVCFSTAMTVSSCAQLRPLFLSLLSSVHVTFSCPRPPSIVHILYPCFFVYIPSPILFP